MAALAKLLRLVLLLALASGSTEPHGGDLGSQCPGGSTCAAASGEASVAGLPRARFGSDSVLLQMQGRLAQAPASGQQAPEATERCDFMVPPATPYFWDVACTNPGEDPNGGLGCRADGLHQECRYCGEAPFTGVECPSSAVWPQLGHCSFEPHLNEPVSQYYWDPTCEAGALGCFADGRHLECRYCGGDGAYRDVPCPSCTFPGVPSLPYFWDNNCRRDGGGLGCRADGAHDECRYCGASPFESVACPESVMPSNGTCHFPVEPLVGYYWEGTGKCAIGVKGCHADGIHVQCRFCGGDGAYADIPCP